MGDTTRDFSRREFACPCGCGLQDPHPVLVCTLQEARSLAGAPFIITGPGRCPAHNAAIGGAPHSKHLPDQAGYTEAVDGHFVGLSLREQFGLVSLLPYFSQGGIGVYLDDRGPRLHLDVRRDGPARWGRLYGHPADIETVLKEEERRGRRGHRDSWAGGAAGAPSGGADRA